eukprot:745833-Hanusia_phi.AAC.2
MWQMSTFRPVGKSDLPDNLKYSKWDHIEVSDDEGDSHPNIDQKLMARLKKEKRARDYEEFRQKHPDAPDPIRAEDLTTSTQRTVVNSTSKETENQKEAKKHKEAGNKHFSKGEYAEAEEYFSKAIELAAPDCEQGGIDAKRQLAVYYNNRAAARWNIAIASAPDKKDESSTIILMDKADQAIEDCTVALKYDFRYVKARLCRAKIHEAKMDLKLAYEDYKRAMSYEPSNNLAKEGIDRLQPEIDRMEEEKLIEITIPEVIPENRTIKYNIPGHGEIELELPEDAVPGQTIKLQLEEEGEAEPEPEDEGGSGLNHHANMYQKSLDSFLKDPTFNNIFMD